jgi:hypothetical protein
LLWTPVLIADFFKFWIFTEATKLTHRAAFAMLPHSVLGSLNTDLSGTNMLAVSLVASSITWVGYFLGFALYMTAMVWIAATVARLSRDGSTGVSCTMKDLLQVKGLPRKTLGLSLLLTAFAGIASISAVAAGSSLANLITHQRLAEELEFFFGLATLVAIYFAARPILRLISSVIRPSDPATAQSREVLLSARILVAITVVTSTGLYFFVTSAENSLLRQPSFLSDPLPTLLMGIAVSFTTALPYIPMMIALTLLSLKTEDELPSV